MNQILKLPTGSKEAKLQLMVRMGQWEKLIEDKTTPDWALDALRRAFRSIPAMKQLLNFDEIPEGFRKGFGVAAASDTMLPLLKEMADDAAERAKQAPSDPKSRAAKDFTEQFHAKIEKGLRKVTSDFLIERNPSRDDFLAGLNAWPKNTPGNWAGMGNLATGPYLYLALFWREFAQLKTIKEAYDGLLVMFDRDESLAGTFAAFLKRAEAIHLKYPIKVASR